MNPRATRTQQMNFQKEKTQKLQKKKRTEKPEILENYMIECA